jgi:hypothetical protein
MRILVMSETKGGFDYLFLTQKSAEYYLTQCISGDYHTFQWELDKVTIRWKLGNKSQSSIYYFVWREVA